MYTEQDKTAIVLWIIVIAIMALLVFFHYLDWFKEFKSELRYLKIEITRTKGRERKHWKRKKKKILLSALPFFKYHRF